MYYEWMQQNKKTLLISVVVVIFLITLWGIATFIERNGKVGVTIKAVPSDAIIVINNKKTKSGTHWLKAGEYTISAQKDGFKTRTKTIVANGDKDQNAVALSLTPVSEAAQQWAKKNEHAYKKNEEYGAIEARANGKYLKEKNPITNVLPYSDPYYEISYELQQKNILVTISTPSPRYRYIAVQKIRDLGFNPSEYKIVFKDFKNPLGDRDE